MKQKKKQWTNEKKKEQSLNIVLHKIRHRDKTKQQEMDRPRGKKEEREKKSAQKHDELKTNKIKPKPKQLLVSIFYCQYGKAEMCRESMVRIEHQS